MAMSRPDGLPLHEGEFDYSQMDTPTFTGEAGRIHVALATFNHEDADFASDPLSTNRRLLTEVDFPVLGTIAIAGPTPETIEVMAPDCLVLPEGPDVRIDLHHVVTLRLGSVVDMGHDLPPPDLALALCPNSLALTLGLQRRAYWNEVNPLLQQWKNVNNSRCPECDRLIRVNMSRHLCLMHTTHLAHYGSPLNLMRRIISSAPTGSGKVKAVRSMSASANLAWSGSVAGHSLISGNRPARLYGWT